MANQSSKRKVVGQQEDGSFDLSDAPEDPNELAELYEQTHEAPGDEADEGGAPDDEPGADADAVAPADEDLDEFARRLRAERDEAVDARKRAMADLVNYRRRADENEVRARHDGVVRVVRSLIPILDQLDLALAQDEADITVEQLLQGVRMIRGELGKALETHVVSVVDPAVGDEFDPVRHQAVMREATDDAEPNTIAAVLQIGYAVGDTVVRPASVKVNVPADADG